MNPSDPHSLTRRETFGAAAGVAAGGLVLGGVAAGAGALTPEALAACATLTPEQEEGPYYVDLEKVRSHVRSGKTGMPLRLRIRVANVKTCKPIHNAAVDIWHCDALGVYSDIAREGTVGRTWLRGVQLTGKTGYALFHTIFPGHYQGRTTHIHLKVHVGGRRTGSKYSGGHVSHTGQLFFPEALSKRIYTLAPYSKETTAYTTHAQDRPWTEQHGAKSLLAVKRLGSNLKKHGVLATITIGVNPGSTPSVI